MLYFRLRLSNHICGFLFRFQDLAKPALDELKWLTTICKPLVVHWLETAHGSTSRCISIRTMDARFSELEGECKSLIWTYPREDE